MKNDMVTFEEKMQENIKNMSGSTQVPPKPEDFPTPPEPMKKVEASRQDLKLTSSIIVVSQENNEATKNIEAIEIVIN